MGEYLERAPLRRAGGGIKPALSRWLWALLCGALLCGALPSIAAAQVRYQYDSLGRLIQAVAPDGGSVQYSYDAAGNITAIRRVPASTLSLIDFSPKTGAVGSSVTLVGSGFSPSATGNTVSFNGTPATVAAASAHALTVTVPAGATTGRIVVGNGSGSVSSALDFTVGTVPGGAAPSIASFTPQMGPAGTVVSVTGSGFQTGVAANKVRFGTALALVVLDAESPSPGFLKAGVPAGIASGKVAITTPNGTAVSAQDFYALPATVNAADVDVAARIAVDGPTLTVATTAAGKKAVLLFDASVGQRLHFVATGSTYASSVAAAVYRSDGTQIESLTLANNNVADFSKALTQDGTYTVVLTPGGAGAMQLALVSDRTGELTVGGSTPISLGTGRNARYTFEAEVGKGYGLALTGLAFTPTGGSLIAFLQRADGTQLSNCSFSSSTSCDFSPANFTTSGTYLLQFDPSGMYGASFNAVLSKDAEGTLSVDAAEPAVVAIAREGHNARYTFSGTAGQLVSVVLGGNTLDDGNASTTNQTYAYLYKPSSPNASHVGAASVSGPGAGAVLDVALPETGTYTVWVTPSGLDKGTVNLQVKSFITGDLAVDSSTPVNLSAGRKARFSFTAEAGKGYGLALGGLSFTSTGGSLTAYLRKGDGTLLTTCSFSSGGSCDLSPAYFTTSGTYVLDFYPTGVYGASFNAVLSKDAEGTLSVDAAEPAVVTIAREGHNARYTFSGTAGQLVSVMLSGNTLDDGNASTTNHTYAYLYKPSSPNATPVSSISVSGPGAGAVLDIALPETGTYTVWVTPSGLDKGTVNLQVKSFVTGDLTMDGSTPVTLSAGRKARLSFTAEAGKGYGLALSGLSFTSTAASLTAYLRKGDGTLLTSCTFSSSTSCDLGPAYFTASGTYLLDFYPSGLYGASFNAVLSKDAEGTMSADAAEPAVVTIAREGQNARYTFSGTAGQLVSVVLSGHTLDDGSTATTNYTALYLYRPSSPNANPVSSTSVSGTGAGVALDVVLPETGTYTVWVAPTGLDKGTVNLQVKSFMTGDLAVDSSTPVNLSAGRKARFSFAAEAGKGYGLALGGLSFTPTGGSLTAYLRKADGTLLTSCAFSSSTSCDLGPGYFTASGTYLLDFYPSGVYGASFNAVLNKDAEGTLSVDAAEPAVVTIAREGQNARYTFSGTAGQLVSVVLSGNTLDDGSTATANYTYVYLYKPSSPTTNQVSYTYLSSGAAGTTLDVTLPETGFYTIWVTPTGLDKGTVNLQVKSFLTGDLAMNGSTPVNLSAGRKARFSFTAEAGKGYGLLLSGLSFTPAGGSLTGYLRKADGTQLASCSFGSSNNGCDLSPAHFTASGTYLLDFYPSGLYGASFSAVLSKDAEGTLSVDAAEPAVVTIAREGQNARYTFSGTAGQLVSVVLSGNMLDDGNTSTANYTYVYLYKPSSPNSNQVSYTYFPSGAAGSALDVTLPETGTYTVWVAPTGPDTGTVNLQAKSFVTGALAMNGSTAVNLSAGRKARLSFTAEAGKGYGLALTGLGFTPTGGSLTGYLRKADGTLLTSCNFSSTSCDLSPAHFTAGGTYLLDFYPSGVYGAAFNAVLSKDAEGTLSVDAAEPAVVTIAREGQNARYTFSGTAGQLVRVVLGGNTLDDGSTATTNYTYVYLYKPSSPNTNQVSYTYLSSGAAGTTLDVTLPETGVYTVWVTPTGLDKGAINLQVRNR